MREADAFVAVLPAAANGVPWRTDGTCVELGWASALGRPILLLVDTSASYSHLITGLPNIAVVQVLSLAAVQLNPSLLTDELRAIFVKNVRPAPLPSEE
jgi:nucleoside 2-deoxyribosyltransferase